MSQPAEKAPRVPDLGRFRMGEWEVQQPENTLRSEGRTLRLEPRMMDVLVSLAAEPGRVVSKEALLATVWGGAFVEEGALTQVIHGLRKALGDDARQPRYIQTIPRRGYRLVAAVELAPDEPGMVSPRPSRLGTSMSFFRDRRRLIISRTDLTLSPVNLTVESRDMSVTICGRACRRQPRLAGLRDCRHKREETCVNAVAASEEGEWWD